MRSTITTLARSRAVMVGLIATVVLAVAGTTLGYSALASTVTLTVDGETREVSAAGETVADVLAAEGVELGERDLVAPQRDEAVEDGSAITVQYAKPLTLEVDGEEQTHWVYATDIDSALSEIGRGFRDADLSLSRGGDLDRSGATLEVTTPKKVTLVIAGGKAKKRTLTVATVADALGALVRQQGWDDRLSAQRVFTDWSSIVGPEVARHSTVDGYEDAVLHVTTDSTAWATQLRLLAPRLVARLNEELGDGAVLRIEVRGPQAPSWKRGPRSVKGRGPRDTYG